jgi:predicted metalloprotease with PDZ domain
MMLFNRTILYLGYVLLCFSTSTSANTELREHDEYRVQLDTERNLLMVVACFKTDSPDYLVAGSENAASLITSASLGQKPGQQALLINRARILLNPSAEEPCLNYQVDLKKLNRNSNSGRISINLGNTLNSQAGDWLWLPADKSRTIRVRFTLPKGFFSSAPWHLISRTETESMFEFNAQDDIEESRVLIGQFSQGDIHVEGARIRLAIVGKVSKAEINKLTKWVSYGAESIVALYGRYPLSDPQIVVFAIGPYDSAVPWGEVQRNGGCVANLYVDQTRPLNELVNDWTLIHELSHMIHPYLDMSGRWLTEGVATYYQNVLQARVGTFTEEKAWTKLHQGFQRGIKETKSGESLINISSNMRENRKYMRVYWSGVALVLKADTMLRIRSNSSLDVVLKKFQSCCLSPNRTWNPREYINKLDELSNTRIFSRLYEEYAFSDKFPDLDEVYELLGMIGTNKKLKFSADADPMKLRQSIMRKGND